MATKGNVIIGVPPECEGHICEECGGPAATYAVSYEPDTLSKSERYGCSSVVSCKARQIKNAYPNITDEDAAAAALANLAQGYETY